MLIFKCWSCEQEFKISFHNLHNKVSIQCHNCDQPLPKSALDPLRRLGDAYMDVVDSLHFDNTFENSWSVSIESTAEFIPKQRGQYGFDDPSSADSFWLVRRKPHDSSSKNNINDSDLPF